jgi:hypothetical protein
MSSPIETSGNFDPVLTTKEAAARLRKHPATLWKWRQLPDCGGLPFIQISNGTIGYRESHVEALLDARTVSRAVVGRECLADAPERNDLEIAT